MRSGVGGGGPDKEAHAALGGRDSQKPAKPKREDARVRKKRKKFVTFAAKARKKPRLSTRFIAKWSVLAFLVIGAAVLYVWQKNVIITLGYDITGLKKEIREAGEEELKLQVKLAPLHTTQYLLKKVQEKGLDFQEVPQTRLITLATPPPLEEMPAIRRVTHNPPAASGSLATPSATTPHRESIVLQQKR